MKSFKHIEIVKAINEKFNLTSYSQGNFIYFKKNNCEIGFIEKIPQNKNYFFTIYSSFFNFDNPELNKVIVKEIQNLYIEQKKQFSKPTNIVLANANGIPQEFLFN